MQIDNRDPLLIQLPQQIQIRAWKSRLRPLQQNALRRALYQLLKKRCISYPLRDSSAPISLSSCG